VLHTSDKKKEKKKDTAGWSEIQNNIKIVTTKSRCLTQEVYEVLLHDSSCCAKITAATQLIMMQKPVLKAGLSCPDTLWLHHQDF
jgi:hypothetical protein